MNVKDDLDSRLAEAPVVPLVVPEDAASAIETTRALVAGGGTGDAWIQLAQ